MKITLLFLQTTLFISFVFLFITCLLEESWIQSALFISLASITKPFVDRSAKDVFRIK